MHAIPMWVYLFEVFLIFHRVKQCTDENQTLMKRIKTLQSQNHSLTSQLKKLQSLLSGAPAAPGGPQQGPAPATCLLVLLLSLALVVAPSLRPPTPAPTPGSVAHTQLLSTVRRALLSAPMKQHLGNFILYAIQHERARRISSSTAK